MQSIEEPVLVRVARRPRESRHLILTLCLSGECGVSLVSATSRVHLFRERIHYHFIFKHYRSFAQIYAGNPVLKPRMELLPRVLKPIFADRENGTRFTATSAVIKASERAIHRRLLLAQVMG
jgi:hypothetical protein